MAIELQDTDTFEGTINDGSSEQLEVKTTTADYAQILLDDGTTGGLPPSYNLTKEYYVPEFDDYMESSVQNNQTAISVRTNPRGAKVRYTIENVSGGNGTYRIALQSFKEI